jgi:peptide/nickel transport system substrate-binding protein
MEQISTKQWRRYVSLATAGLLALTVTVAGASSSSAVTATKGGTLTIGVAGGGSTDSLDAHTPANEADIARVHALYESLAGYTASHKIKMELALAITSNANATVWTVRLRPNLKFSDGSALTSADVIGTLKRVIDGKKAQATSLAGVDMTKTKATNKSTVVITLKAPNSTFIDTLASYALGIVPSNYDPKKPVGAGAFKYESFTPGQQSTFEANPNYYKKGQPYVDKLVIRNFADDNSRIAALLSKQVDAITSVPSSQTALISNSGFARILESKTGAWHPFTMRVDKAPFDDVRVRQAFRLIVDRPAMIKQVLGGHGTIGNDLYAPLDQCYNSSLPQRKQDIAQAKALLAAAGKSNLTVDLTTSSGISGTALQEAQVFAEQAKAAGVTVNIKNLDSNTYWGGYLEYTFSQSFWYTRDFIPQTDAGSLPTAPYNESNWADATFIDLVSKARAASNISTRCGFVKQAQQIEYDKGGLIIWGFNNQIDAYSSKVQGLSADKSGIPLMQFGFDSMWLKK